jgi:hypothetical protein
MQGVHCGQCRKEEKKENQQAQVQKETQGQSSQEEIGPSLGREICGN